MRLLPPLRIHSLLGQTPASASHSLEDRPMDLPTIAIQASLILSATLMWAFWGPWRDPW